MHAITTPASLALASRPAATHPVPIDQLLRQVYESAQPTVRTRMLSMLMGHAYEACPMPVRRALLAQLLGAISVLDLVDIAGGVFAGIRRRDRQQPPQVLPEDLDPIHTADVITLVDHVQQRSMQALVATVRTLATDPALACSGAVALLEGILLPRRQSQRQDRNPT